jgi:hypothetical protein
MSTSEIQPISQTPFWATNASDVIREALSTFTEAAASGADPASVESQCKYAIATTQFDFLNLCVRIGALEQRPDFVLDVGAEIGQAFRKRFSDLCRAAPVRGGRA